MTKSDARRYADNLRRIWGLDFYADRIEELAELAFKNTALNRQRDYFEEALDRMTQEQAQAVEWWREAERQLREAQEVRNEALLACCVWQDEHTELQERCERLAEVLREEIAGYEDYLRSDWPGSEPNVARHVKERLERLRAALSEPDERCE